MIAKTTYGQKIETIVTQRAPALVTPLTGLADALSPQVDVLQNTRVTHSDHFIATTERALFTAGSNPDAAIILGASAQTHDLCPRDRIMASDARDEFARQGFRWCHMAEGSALGTLAIVGTGHPAFFPHLGTIAILNALHDAGSARFTVALSPPPLHQLFIDFASLDTLGMIAYPKGGIGSGFIDGPLHSLWAKQIDAPTPEVFLKVLVDNAQRVRERQTALLGLPQVPAALMDCFPSAKVKELCSMYQEEWKKHFGVSLA